jgi:thioredoxin-like negative regulator of GroEL
MKTKKWIEKAEFEQEILKSPEPRIVLFAADWCGYCRRFLSIVNDYQNDKGKLQPPSDEVAVVNVDSDGGSLWNDFKIDLVPTLAVFHKSVEIFRRNGKSFVGLGQKDLEDAVNSIKIKNK